MNYHNILNMKIHNPAYKKPGCIILFHLLLNVILFPCNIQAKAVSDINLRIFIHP